MANKSLPPINPVLRAAYNTVERLTKKLQAGKVLSASEQKSYQRNMRKLIAGGYTAEEVNNSIVGKLGNPRNDIPGFGFGDITVGNPLDSAKYLLEKTKVAGLMKFLGEISDPHTWLRVAFILLGAILFLVGLALLLKELTRVKIAGTLNPLSNAKTIAKTAKGAVA